QSIQDEIDQRLAEINRVSQQTEFNGIKVLSKDQTLSIQVGANDGQTIDINLGEINTAKLGLEGFSIMDMVPATEVVQGMQVVGGAAGDTKYNLSTQDVADLEAKLFKDGGEPAKMFAFTGDDGNTAFLGLDKEGNWTVSTATVTAAQADGTPASIAFDDAVAVVVGTDAAGIAAKSLETLQTMDDALAQVDAMRSG
ncbi:flagellin FliC, partial [Morganella morganii]